MANDLRQRLPAPKDQGRRPTCLAFAVTSVHELARAGGGNVQEDLSEEALYWGCKRKDGDLGPGSRFSSAQAALRGWGQPLEETWPYDATHDDSKAIPRMPATAKAAGWFRNRLRRVAVKEAALKAELDAGRVVAVGVRLSQAFVLSGDGVIPAPTPGDLMLGGHAVTLVGYDDAHPSGNGVFVFRNSWGPTWGDGGYGYLPYSYLVNTREAWTVEGPTQSADSRRNPARRAPR